MENPSEAFQQIRYQLSRLSVENGHHTFETICRKLSLERICPNILPATGPVSAGGDGSRDFETFRTYLSGLASDTRFFGGESEGKAIAFACTLAKSDLPTKVKSDLRGIADGATDVDAVYFFTEQPIPVAKRNELKKHAKDEHGLHLEILDGEAVAEQLAARDTFWIATAYLHLPSDLLPATSKDEETWYEQQLREWKAKDEWSLSLGNFLSVREAARHAGIDEPEHKRDLPFWMRKLDSFREADELAIQRRAMYETIVIPFRSERKLAGSEGTIRAFLNGALELTDSALLEDAQIVSTYCAGALARGIQFDITQEELDHTRAGLLKQIRTVRAAADRPFDRVRLDMALTSMMMMDANPEVDREVLMSEVFGLWGNVLDEAEKDDLLPISFLPDMLEKVAPALCEFSEYDDFTERLDKIVGSRSGRAVTSEQRRARAKALVEAGHLVRAVDEFHRVKDGWLQEETLRGNVLAMVMIASIYERLGLWLAAKYYYMAAAITGIELGEHENADLGIRAMLEAGRCDYRMGRWIGYLHTVRAAFVLHHHYNADSTDLAKHPFIEQQLLPLASCRSIADAHVPGVASDVARLVTETGLSEYLDEMLEDIPNTWADLAAEEVADKAAAQIGAWPFSDCGARCTYSWQALGIHWTVNAENSLDSILAAERLGASLQVLAVELADLDLCVTPTDVTINVEVGDDQPLEPSVEHTGGNDGREWKIVLSRSGDGASATADHLTRQSLAALVHLLLELSMRSGEEVMSLLTPKLERGLLGRLFPASAYDVLVRRVMFPETFDEITHRTSTDPLRGQADLHPEEHEELAPFTNEGPGYSVERSTEDIENRYSNCLSVLRFTIERLRQHGPYQDAVRELREAGWQDWRILIVTMLAAINFRANTLTASLADKQEEINRLKWEPEAADADPIPLEVFDQKRLVELEPIFMLSYLANWKMRCRAQVPDFEGIRSIAQRFGYFDDDVPHEDPFAGIADEVAAP